MFLPSKPRGTSTNQHEQAWTMKLVSISHVFSITCIACCNVLWHNLIFHKLNDFSVTMYLQNDSTTECCYKLTHHPESQTSWWKQLFMWKILSAGWATNIPAQQIVETNDAKMLTNDLFQENHPTARPLAWEDFGGISSFCGPGHLSF